MKNEIISIIVMLIIVIASWYAIANAKPVEYTGEYTLYTISKNDTLWSIAKVQNHDCDIREVVYKIKKDNNIENCGDLQVGQQILLRDNY